MQSDFHNLPTINGVMQKDGREFHSRERPIFGRCQRRSSSRSISQVPIRRQRKSIAGSEPLVLNRGKSIEVSEDYQLKEAIKPIG